MLACLLPALVMAACAAPPPSSVASPVQERMFAHFALARDLRTLAVIGDLAQIREVAAELAVADETWGLPPGSGPWVEEVRAAARRAAQADDPTQAALATAEVAAVCGRCHIATDATLGVRFQVAEPLLDDPATRHVNYLAWVSRLLWSGMVGPSERMWHAGAHALREGDGLPAPRARSVPDDEVARTSTLLRELGAEAAQADHPTDRTQVLASILAVCADCHVKAGVR